MFEHEKSPAKSALAHKSRPSVEERTFYSPAVESEIERVKSSINNKDLARLFENAFPNTLDTTYEGDGFMITGDIPAMWLRDSSAQVHPYLPLAEKDPALKQLVKDVVRRQAKYISIDPYANAFNKDYEKIKSPHWITDVTEKRPGVFERKWEPDSLCWFLRLSSDYYKNTGDRSIFDADWKKAADNVVKTFIEQQRKEDRGPYRFERRYIPLLPGISSSVDHGLGRRSEPVGLIHSWGRPSDDACHYPFLIPDNMFAVVELEKLSKIYSGVYGDKEKSEKAEGLSKEIKGAIEKYGVVDDPKYGKIYAYEVDGRGNALLMDDANIPSLLSSPYLGYNNVDDPVYQNTRKFILSKDNPYFFKGKFGEGVGSPHTFKNRIWPLAVIMRAMTSTDNEEIGDCLKTLVDAHKERGFMHESFNKDNPRRFSRPWFAWANSMFGELMLKLTESRFQM